MSPTINDGSAGPAPQPRAAKSRHIVYPAEPQGRGLRVVMQRLSVTQPGLLRRPFMFQVPPLEEFPVQHGWDFVDYDTVGDGYRTRPASTQLTTVSFDSMFVDQDYGFVVNKSRPFNPVQMLEELKAIGDSRTPFQLIAGQPDLWGVYYDLNIAATMRSLRRSEKAGEIDARYFTISFTQFRGVSQSQLNAGLQGDLTRSGNQTIASLTIDQLPANLQTLRAISKKYYGTVTLWSVIARASGSSAPGSANLKAYYKNYSPKPKIVVPSAAIARAAGR